MIVRLVLLGRELLLVDVQRGTTTTTDAGDATAYPLGFTGTTPDQGVPYVRRQQQS